MRKRPRQFSASTIGIYAVAVLLLANLIAMLGRNDYPSLLPAAYAQANRQAPIAGGAGMFVMPAQLASNMWGCYLMDVDRGTLCVYQFFPGTKQLQFVAARKFGNDTRLDNFNTIPAPQEIGDLVEKQTKPNRAEDPANQKIQDVPGVK